MAVPFFHTILISILLTSFSDIKKSENKAITTINSHLKPQQKISFLSKFCLGYCIRVYLGFSEKLNEIVMLLLLEFIQFLQQLHETFTV